MLAGFAVLSGCARPGEARAFVRAPQQTGPRPSGCIDTPFIGGDAVATTAVTCGRERSPNASILRGRVVSEELGGLPGAGIEGVWVTLHPLDDRPLRLDALPPAIAQTQTGPQGSFAVPLGRRSAIAYVIAVRLEPDSAPLTAQRVEGQQADQAGQADQVVLRVPRHSD
ncbi:hypothetical protein DB30_04070 [Enhygromyxa salina]|uniref:Uncharacterized protein n=1 Tax=Enhygromyxa salina TaxID=215803 RepID=A0A0C2A0J7_9BACT|nr:hypothetical protein DB30_04070 [Enhygromyxa salina]